MQKSLDIAIEQADRVAGQLEALGKDAIQGLHRLRDDRGILYDAGLRGSTTGPSDPDGRRDELQEPAPQPKAADGTGERPDEGERERRFSWSTVVGTDALLEALTTRPEWFHDNDRVTTIAELLPCLLDQDVAAHDPRLPQPDGDSAVSLLETAVLARALARLVSWRPSADAFETAKTSDWTPKAIELHLRALQDEAEERLQSVVADLLGRLSGVAPAGWSQLHPYVVLRIHDALESAVGVQARRGASGTSGDEEAASFENGAEAPGGMDPGPDPSLMQNELWKAHRGSLECLIASSAMGTLSPDEAVRLVFYAGLADQRGAREHAAAALEGATRTNFAATTSQRGRVLVQEERADHSLITFSVPLFELLTVLGRVVDRSLADDQDVPLANRAQVLDVLLNSLEAVRAAHVQDADFGTGWVAETNAQRIVEAWPTATVLTVALTLHEVVDGVERRQLLEALDAKSSWDEDWPTYLHWSHYLANEPDEDARILEFIDRTVVQPRLGAGATIRGQVLLLFGPPGTTKTSIARSVANGLRWPIVLLNPGDFIQGGMDQIEQNSRRIFNQLEKLSRTVVILDECDELFRERDPAGVADAARQISAFMTASMLPKLQELHDRSRVVVFICTNFLTSMDPAIKRPGRIDYFIAVPPYDAAQCRRTIEDQMNMDPERRAAMSEQVYRAAVDTAVANISNLIRGEVVNLARELGKAPFDTVEEAQAAAKRLAQFAMKEERRTIKTTGTAGDAFKRFCDDMKAISEPHRIVVGMDKTR